MLGFGHTIPKLRQEPPEPPEPSFFDQFGTPAAAYSLRDLSGTNPAVIEVRRDSDNALLNFSASQIIDGSLAAWVGAGYNGFVRTWYDQTGGGNNAQQNTTANQPQIVSAGVLLTDSAGNPKIDYQTSAKSLITPTLTMGNNEITLFSYRKSDSTFVQVVYELSANWTMNAFTFASTSNELGNETTQSRGNASVRSGQVAKIASPPLSQRIVTSEYHNLSASLSKIWLNGTAGLDGVAAKGTGTFGNFPLYIGARGGTLFPVVGFISELIIFKADKTAQRVSIEANINSFYAV